MKIPLRFLALFLCAFLALGSVSVSGQSRMQAAGKQLVVLDTDIGDDIDDAFALSLLLESPEVKLLGITTAYGDTELRVRLVDRFLAAVGRGDIPVAAGVHTEHSNVFTQAEYAKRQPARKYRDGVDLLLSEARLHPGEVTLVALGPLGNVGAAIQKDAATFRKLKRVVLMGGSVYRGYGPPGTAPQVEWNAGRDPEALRALLASGVPVFVMPLDSTQIPLLGDELDKVLGYGSPLTDQLAILYPQWKVRSDWHPKGPVLYDPVAAAYALKPELCPMQAMHLDVDAKGMTLPGKGAPNVQVCLKADEKGFQEFLEGRIAPAK
jgi:purine nucleosidase